MLLLHTNFNQQICMKTFFFGLSTTFMIFAIWWWCACFKCNTMQPKKRKKEALTLYNQARIDCKDIYYCKLTNIIFIHTFHMWKSFFISNIQTFSKLYGDSSKLVSVWQLQGFISYYCHLDSFKLEFVS